MAVALHQLVLIPPGGSLPTSALPFPWPERMFAIMRVFLPSQHQGGDVSVHYGSQVGCCCCCCCCCMLAAALQMLQPCMQQRCCCCDYAILAASASAAAHAADDPVISTDTAIPAAHGRACAGDRLVHGASPAARTHSKASVLLCCCAAVLPHPRAPPPAVYLRCGSTTRPARGASTCSTSATTWPAPAVQHNCAQVGTRHCSHMLAPGTGLTRWQQELLSHAGTTLRCTCSASPLQQCRDAAAMAPPDLYACMLATALAASCAHITVAVQCWDIEGCSSYRWRCLMAADLQGGQVTRPAARWPGHQARRSTPALPQQQTSASCS
jgi:hypothetical protein